MIYHFNVNTTGVNTFSIPFSLSSAIKDNGGTEITPFATIADLIKAINAQGTGDPVTVFGWWDDSAAPQKHVGLTSIAYNPDGTVNPAGCLATGATDAATVLGMGIVPNRAYQVTVKAATTFTLTGTK